MEITHAEREDAKAMLDLQKIAFQSQAVIYNDQSLSPLHQTLDEIMAEFDINTFFKATINRRIVGSVRARIVNDTCHIERLIVHPGMQGQGIGTALMKYIEKLYSKAKRFELYTGSKSERNLYLYRKLGYKAIRSERMNDRVVLVNMEKVMIDSR